MESNSNASYINLTSSSLLRDLNHYASESVGLIVSVYKNDKLVRNFLHGKINNESDVLISNETLVHLGSNTKAFTSALVMLSHLDWKLNLSDPIYQWIDLESFRQRPNITIKHLLRHESGLKGNVPSKYWHELYSSTFNPEEILKKIESELFESNKKTTPSYHYSNLGFAILGMILEKAYQLEFAEILKRNLLSPLGILNFMLGDDHCSLTDETIIKRTWPHIKNEDGLLSINPNVERSDNPKFYRPSTNLLLSHNDWIKLFKLYKDREFQSLQNIIRRDFTNPHFEDYSIAGWFIKTHHIHGEIWSHSGANGGNSSFARFYKNQDIVLLINFNTHDDDLMMKIVETMDIEIMENILGH